MLIFQLALKNILGAGLKTWLNVFVLSLTFVIIIWHRGFFEGMLRQAESAMIESELAGGQYWHEAYDPYDPLTFEDSHAVLSDGLKSLVKSGKASPVLITTASIYPEGRMQPVLMKGINPEQQVVALPTRYLTEGESTDLTAIIGARTANSAGLKEGDYVTVRWRDVHGTFDAADVRIAHIFSSAVPTVDANQIWVSLQNLQNMLNAPGEASIITLARGTPLDLTDQGVWISHDLEFLLKDIKDMVATKKIGGLFLHVVLFSIALLAIFDTQMLSIFRRRKEMGTMMALGMTRRDLIRLFTLEGTMHGFLAFAVGCVYGIPLLVYTAIYGFKLPEATEQAGYALGSTLYPVYPASLIVITFAILFVIILTVSYYPARRISRLKPTDALRGKMS